MKKVQQRKKIIIPFNGYIGILGVMGPVEIPYMETLETIAKLLMRRIPVYEITSDGSKIKLTMSNYRKNNGTEEDAIKKTYEPANTPKKKKVNVITVTDEDIENNSVSNLLKNSTKKLAESKDYDSNKKKDKKNKHWKNNEESNPVYVGVPGSDVDSDMVETK